MTRQQQRRDTAANWTANNTILLNGEYGIETDALPNHKIGDGVTAWNSLPYANDVTKLHNGPSGTLAANASKSIRVNSSGTAWEYYTPTSVITDHTSLSNIGTNTHAQIDTFIASKGANSGLASLDTNGKVPTSQLPSSVTGGLSYKGTFDASSGSYPSSPSQGYYYVVSVAGTVSSHSYNPGDWIVYNGTSWDYIDSTDQVASVNGQTGAVTLTSANITENTNLYFTDERAQDAVGNILTDTNSVDFTYNDASNLITADVKVNSTSLEITASGVGVKDNTYLKQPSGLTQGDIFYYNGTTIARLAPDTAGKVLICGGAGANPAWNTIDGGSSTST